MKKDLIELFKLSCNDFTISRSNAQIGIYVDCDTSSKIMQMLPSEISVPGMKKPFKTERWNMNNNFIGFRFKDEPPIGIGITWKEYSVEYGYFFPIISYAFWNNYIKRKKYCEFVKNNWVVGTDYDYDFCTLEKKVRFEKRTRFIIHGTLVEELTFEEYKELCTLYKDKVAEFDKYQLQKRLGKL